MQYFEQCKNSYLIIKRECTKLCLLQRIGLSGTFASDLGNLRLSAKSIEVQGASVMLCVHLQGHFAFCRNKLGAFICPGCDLAIVDRFFKFTFKWMQFWIGCAKIAKLNWSLNSKACFISLDWMQISLIYTLLSCFLILISTFLCVCHCTAFRTWIFDVLLM